MTTLFGALELNWAALQPFDFFLFPEPLLGLRGSGLVRGKILIREKEWDRRASPIPKNKIVSIVARLPASLKRGLEKAQGSDMVFVKFYGYRQWKGQGPLRSRFFVQAVSPKREKEILEACRVRRNQWP